MNFARFAALTARAVAGQPCPVPKEKRDHKEAKAAFYAYCNARDLKAIERRQDYTYADLIADLMHLLESKGFDAERVVNSGMNHFDVEHGEEK